MTALLLVISVFMLIIRASRKKTLEPTTKYKDFISIGAMYFTGYVLIRLLIGNDITQIESTDAVTKFLQIAVPALLVLFLLILAILMIVKDSNIARDERTEISSTKSTRNALLGMSFALFAFLSGGSMFLERNSIIIIMAAGYFTFMCSKICYYFL
jgi:hypothetical protein